MLLAMLGCTDEKARNAEAEARNAAALDEATARARLQLEQSEVERKARLAAAQAGDPASWAAAGLSWEHQGRTVEVAGATIGRPTHVAKGLGTSAPVETKELRLVVRLKFSYPPGAAGRPLQYWSDSIHSSTRAGAALLDESGARVAFVEPEEGRCWSGRTGRLMLQGGDSADDVLAFELPDPASKELRLFLPGWNIGLNSENVRLRFAPPAGPTEAKSAPPSTP